ncbi:Methyltransferase domain-containing protein [Salinihabitans flavidus]|uniref:Methyltransferase domain-containing protein n=1 Tax=Salinihabitans flavidus TaxID=569882 RepID=A0A1H8NE33_9RHOB|nr:methyltransferase domain-containing protein [Salinihabitans flavidus]SEO27728.1 Methyltransferase domain-containing protein [Salinihabitans flavidus]
MTDKFLDKAYGLDGADDMRGFYDQWAASYEDEVAEYGYTTPGRCADALKQHCRTLDEPVLDFGCGTGLSGLALRWAGFKVIDGVDISAEMLEGARSKDVYRDLRQITADEPPSEPGVYGRIAAIGAIGAGAAPLGCFDTLMDVLATGGKIVLSFNDHTLEDPIYEARINEYLDGGFASLLFREHGDHLPGRNVKSIVYVIEKK